MYNSRLAKRRPNRTARANRRTATRAERFSGKETNRGAALGASTASVLVRMRLLIEISQVSAYLNSTENQAKRQASRVTVTYCKIIV
jgi:undecaprenyl pyrophosphate synthase